jgi:hyperosmotically inducible protein
MSLGAALVIIVLVLAIGWFAFVFSTRGWDQTRDDMRSTFQSAVYAAKETSLDAALTAKVKAALALNKGIPSSEISVESRGDVVTLRGDVPSDDVKKRAESVARNVPGVGNVQNELFVKPSAQ